MKKAIIYLTKRHTIDNNTTNKILIQIFESSFSETEIFFQNTGRSNYSLQLNGQDKNLKISADNAATIGSMNTILNLNRFIPDFWDSSKRLNLKFEHENGHYPKVRVEVIDYEKGVKANFKIAIYFETESFILLDNIGDKLLLAFPNETMTEDDIQKHYEVTFFLKLDDDIFFNDYKSLV